MGTSMKSDESVSEYLSRRHKELEESYGDLKAKVFKTLKGLQLKRVQVNFDGCGDSGQIDSVAYGKTATGSCEENKTIDETPVEGVEITDTTRWDEKAKDWVSEMRAGNLRDAIEQLCYDLLEMEHGGWEINEGSFGTFEFTIKDNLIHLAFSQRVQTTEESEHEY